MKIRDAAEYQAAIKTRDHLWGIADDHPQAEYLETLLKAIDEYELKRRVEGRPANGNSA